MLPAASVLAVGVLSGCSYYVDTPEVSLGAGPDACKTFSVPLTKISDGMVYIECTRENLTDRRWDADRRRAAANYVIAAGAAGAAVGALFNAGRSAIIGSGLGAGAGLAYSQIVDNVGYEAAYGAGLITLDCPWARMPPRLLRR